MGFSRAIILDINLDLVNAVLTELHFKTGVIIIQFNGQLRVEPIMRLNISTVGCVR